MKILKVRKKPLRNKVKYFVEYVEEYSNDLVPN